MKKAFLAVAAAALALAPAAAPARPQWVQLGTNGRCHANYNAIRKIDPQRLTFTMPISCEFEGSVVTAEAGIYCEEWASTLSAGDGVLVNPYGPIGKGTVAEHAAYLVCK
jgi:hypothetical protein